MLLFILFGLLVVLSRTLGLQLKQGFKISLAKNEDQLSSAIKLRFPLIKAPKELTELCALYLPRYLDKLDPILTYLATDASAPSNILGALHLSPSSLVLHDLTVDERFRRLGIATALMAHAFDQQRSLTVKQKRNKPIDEQQQQSITLSVINKNTAARKLYESVGFKVDPETPSFYLNTILCPPLLIGMTRNLQL